MFVNELGNQEIEVEDNNQLYNLTMSILNVCLDVEAELYVKIMRINPRFILLNHTTRPMVFRQKDGTLQS